MTAVEFLSNKKAPAWSLFAFCLILFIPVVPQVSQAGQYAVASAHPLATKAGMQILQQGGNAFDAAITVSAVLAVVEPYSSGMGGGGFWLLHDARANRQVMIDGREKAPLSAHRDMYLDASGQVIKNASIDGPLAAGIPGQPAALVHLAEHYGKLPLQQTLRPAIEYASKGFEVDDYYRRMAGWRLKALQASEEAARIFLDDGKLPQQGHKIVQPELAHTLQLIADKGFDGFYRGETADKLVSSVRKNGGIWSRDDLARYQVVEREPVVSRYKDWKVISAALPSSGGVVIAQVLNILERYDLKSLTRTEQVHLVVEAMRRAYRDRAEYLGDSDFVAVDVARLVSKAYADILAADIKSDKASVSEGLVEPAKGRDTTHFSIVDKAGNRVAATLSINYPFGSGFVAAGTGILLNDEMDDFSSRPGTPNVYGLVGNEANAIQPGKRMLSSMSPTFVESEQWVAVLGTPGGSRIISMVLLAILEMEKSLDPEKWVNLPRYHHQYLPDVIQHEAEAFTETQQQQLKQLGHRLKRLDNDYGNMHAIIIDAKAGDLKAASDRRGVGSASVSSIK